MLHDGVTPGGKPIELFGRRLFSATSNSLNTGTTPVSLFGTGQGSLVVPANFITAGIVLTARFYGYISTTGSPGNLTFSLLFPGTVVAFTKTPPASLTLGHVYVRGSVPLCSGGTVWERERTDMGDVC